MKRTSTLQVILELIVVLGSFTIGGTILFYHFMNRSINSTLIGLITLAIGMMGLIEFFSMKLEIRLKSILSMLTYIAGIVFGVVFLLLNLDFSTIVLMWGIYLLCLSIAKVFTAFASILKQPLINIVRILSNSTAIVFSIIFLVQSVNFLATYFFFLGILLLVEAFFLLIEFIIHRYQK